MMHHCDLASPVIPGDVDRDWEGGEEKYQMGGLN